LTARIFEGSKEIDPEGEKYIYNWWYQAEGRKANLDVTTVDNSTKKVRVWIEKLKNQEVWFTTSKSNSQTT
jgi:hypothetical protein